MSDVFEFFDGREGSKYVHKHINVEQVPFSADGDPVPLGYDDDSSEKLSLDDGNIEKAYLCFEDGYRGHGVYLAFVKVNGEWYECDVVSEGVAYKIDSSVDVEAALDALEDYLDE